MKRINSVKNPLHFLIIESLNINAMRKQTSKARPELLLKDDVNKFDELMQKLQSHRPQKNLNTLKITP
jgi:hypothetical protein